MKTGIELISEERKEQIEKHGRTIEKDIEFNDNEQLAMCAEMLLAVEHEEGIDSESFPDGWDKEICEHMLSKPYKERLIIAGALIAAEIDRIHRISELETELTSQKNEFIDIEKNLIENGFDFEKFKYDNEYSAKNLLLAMETYAITKYGKLQERNKALIKELDKLSNAYISLKGENKILMFDLSDLKDIALERYKEIGKLNDENKVLELKLSNLMNSQLENQKATKNERN